MQVFNSRSNGRHQYTMKTLVTYLKTPQTAIQKQRLQSFDTIECCHKNKHTNYKGAYKGIFASHQNSSQTGKFG